MQDCNRPTKDVKPKQAKVISCRRDALHSTSTFAKMPGSRTGVTGMTAGAFIPR